MVRVSHNEMYILTINHFPYLLQTAVQILFVGHGHWICTSYSKASSVCIYDSLPPGKELPCDVQIQIARMVELQKMMLFQLNAVNAQKQSGAKDCGVFALANVFHLANGDKVCRINFDQRKMREDVVQCCTKGKFSAFPSSKSSVQRTSSKKVFLQLHVLTTT